MIRMCAGPSDVDVVVVVFAVDLIVGVLVVVAVVGGVVVFDVDAAAVFRGVACFFTPLVLVLLLLVVVVTLFLAGVEAESSFLVVGRPRFFDDEDGELFLLPPFGVAMME